MSELLLAEYFCMAQALGIIATLFVILYFSRKQMQSLSVDVQTKVLNDLDEKVRKMAEIIIENPSMQKVIYKLEKPSEEIAMFRGAFAQDVNLTEADIMAVVQKPINQSILGEKSGLPAWKQLPTWFQVSENDHIIPPDAERLFAKQMNATTLSLPYSHASLVSHPDQIIELILDAAGGSTG